MSSKKALDVMSYFNEILPNAKCELDYSTDYGLLIAVVLSAQTTDKSVNKVTPILFNKFPTLNDLANADVLEIEKCIRQIGLYHNKAKNIKEIAYCLINNFNGKVPDNKKMLLTLPGVGNKTANVVLCELFNQNEFPVDTHVERLAKRLRFAKENDDVLLVEKKLRRAFPSDSYILLHHQFIHFGRYYCTSRNPHCDDCKLKSYCKLSGRK